MKTINIYNRNDIKHAKSNAIAKHINSFGRIKNQKKHISHLDRVSKCENIFKS